MEEETNKPVPEPSKPEEPKKKETAKDWLIRLAKGVAIGLSTNIPGASGGTTAVLVRIYDPMVQAVGSIFKKFKESFLYLLPILVGVIAGFLATYKPMNWALKEIPFGISCVFIGLIVASMPALIKKVKKKPTWQGLVAFFLSLAFMVGLCFIPGMQAADLSTIKVGMCFLVLVMGVIGSFALVVPGVSGAMLLFVFGFYTPLMDDSTGLLHDLVSGHQHIGVDFCYLIIFAVGILIGFFLASKAMGWLLKNHEYTTFMGILGFILGSIYAIAHPFIVGNDTLGRYPSGLYPDVMSQGWHIGLGIILLVVSTGLFLFFYWLSERKTVKASEESK